MSYRPKTARKKTGELAKRGRRCVLPTRHLMYLALIHPAAVQRQNRPYGYLQSYFKALSEPQVADIIRRRHVLMRLFDRSDLQVPA